MYFNIDKLDTEILYKDERKTGIIFRYNKKNYFFKTNLLSTDRYNELIAEKIARKLGINNVKYYLGEYGKYKGVVSEMFDVRNYYSMDYFLNDIYKDNCIERNNLEDIWNALALKFDFDTTKKIMDDIVNIFIFDVLIANSDRHPGNLGLIIKNGRAEVAPLFDNDSMLRIHAMENGSYFLGVEEGDFKYYIGEERKENILEKFIRISGSEYLNRLRDMLPVISEISINEIIKELESEGIIIENYIKNIIKENFKKNYEIIEEKINNKSVKK